MAYLRRGFASSSGFIKSVMGQVRRDMDSNPEFRQALKDFKESSARRQTLTFKEKCGERSGVWAENAKDAGQRCAVFARAVYSANKERAEKTARNLDQTISDNPALSKTKQSISNLSLQLYSILKPLIHKSAALLSKIGADSQNAAHIQAASWRQKMAVKRYVHEVQKRGPKHATNTQNNAAHNNATNNNALNNNAQNNNAEKNNAQKNAENIAQNHAEKNAEDNAENKTQYQQDDSLVLSQESPWERWGAKLKDSPFLQNFFQNPMFGQLFGETEIASSIRLMKALDPTFTMGELTDMIEHVIGPHLVEAFLRGDLDTLKIHLGEGAFGAVRVAVRERKTLGVILDPSILILRNVELRGARTMDQGDAPWFVFTFNTQQINCLRDSKDQVVSGAVDDIRLVTYSIAISRHPKQATPGLQHPWLITEMAIIGNAPSY